MLSNTSSINLEVSFYIEKSVNALQILKESFPEIFSVGRILCYK